MISPLLFALGEDLCGEILVVIAAIPWKIDMRILRELVCVWGGSLWRKANLTLTRSFGKVEGRSVGLWILWRISGEDINTEHIIVEKFDLCGSL